jgi:kumamolisin
MISRRRRALGAAVGAVALALSFENPASAQSTVVLPGHIPRQIAAAAQLGRAPSDERVDLSLVVNLDQALLDQTLAGLYGPNAPANKAFLSSADFDRIFGLTGKRLMIAQFAQDAGLTVLPDQPGSQVVQVYGPSGAVEAAFGVRLHHYQSADGQIFRANDGEPSIPAALAPHLGAVLGLSNFRGAKKPHWVARRPAGMTPAASGQTPLSVIGGGTGPGGALAPADIKTIYGLSGSLTGAGQTVAVYELDGYAQTDINKYTTQFSLPSNTPSCISADNSCFQCGANQNQSCNSTTLGKGGNPTGDGGMVEVALDIDLMIALAPGAQIQVYTAMNSGSGPTNLWAKIAADDTAKVVSTSWGEDEESLGASEMANENTIFKQMATQGQTVFSAAGDAGAYDASGTGSSWQGSLMTDDPASQPYVTGVGGTSLAGTVASPTETVWNGTPGNTCSSTNSPGTNCANDGAGGGGVANFSGTYWPLPSYQSGVATEYSTSFRNVPDVSLNADPNTSPYAICVGGSCNNCSGSVCTTEIGGTSAATPLWAAFAALVNQGRASGGQSNLGFFNSSFLYTITLATGTSYHNVFNDITSGNNGFYNAGAGYDNASGWGSFKGNAMLAALTVPSTITAVTPEFTNVGSSSITVNWSSAGQLAGTVYTAQISTNGFSTVNVSSLTKNAFASFGTGGAGPALVPATTYYFEVQAASGAFTGVLSSLGFTDTLAAAPLAPSLGQVWGSSLTMSWTANGNPAGTAYRVDYWLPSGSTLSMITTSVSPTLTGLAGGGTYYLTVGALNGLGQLAPSGVILSTVTIAQPSQLSVVPSTGGTATIFPPTGLIMLQIPSGALAQTVAVTLAIPSSFPSASSSGGSALTGTGVGIQIQTNPAVEPLTNTLLSIGYQPSNVVGLNPNQLVIARYDPADNVWVPLVSSVNTANGTVTGLTSHWSLFQVMQNAPAQSPSSAVAFPNPWRVSQGPASMTFTQMPAGARLRIYTLAGRLIKDFSADPSGMASWDGTNQSGRPAASGFYFAYIEGAGQSTTLKLALQR